MAGLVPTPVRSSGRKQWTLHDGPRGSLRKLRTQLAEDGCPESQVVLAKQLLEETSELDADKEENEKLGVYWLIKASEQGNTEATEILRHCLRTGQGITEHNYLDVKSCLNMSQEEKLARKAAREMFSSLSAGQDFITSDQLQKKMTRVSKEMTTTEEDGGISMHSENQQNADLGNGVLEAGACMNSVPHSEDREWATAREYDGEKLTEDHLVSAAVNYVRGELPLVHHVLTLSNPVDQNIEAANFLRRTLFHPLNSLHNFYRKLVETLAKRGSPFMSSIFPVVLSQFQTLILLFIYTVLGVDSILLFIPMAAYYVSFFVMVISTFQMLHRKREFRDFQSWSRLFLSYSGGSLNAEEAEYQYCCNNLKPYAHFFLALVINLMIYPVIAPQWTPQSELTILAFSLTLLTLYAFMNHGQSLDLLMLFSFAVNVLAKYPYETDAVVRQGWRFLDIRVPTFASYIVGNGVEFCLNCRAVFYLLIPAIFVKIASRDKWRGIYKALIPHCVSLSWWQVAVISSQGATWYGLIRSALALVGLVLIVPIMGIATVLLPVLAAGKYLADSAIFIRVVTTALLASAPVVATWYINKQRAKGGVHQPMERYFTRFQVGLGIAAAVFLLLPLVQEIGSNQHQQTEAPDADTSLTWEQYQNYCHQPAWEESSVTAVQLRCIPLAGAIVTWDGYVTKVKVTEVSNTLRDITSKLPRSVRDIISCWYGEPSELDCNSVKKENEAQICKIVRGIQRSQSKCHLESFNRYKFEVTVNMKSGMFGRGAEVILIADDFFRNFTFAVKPRDHIWFSGTLVNEEGDSILGGTKPRVDLNEIGCLDCHMSHLQIHRKTSTKIGLENVLDYVYVGMKFVLNFVFNPLVIFK
ncbi:wolframin [Schistocerca nitens]|uniref:wolframin n=1 Tax=Schistocerca nitens TaxID=7011 RepID=UPI0021197E73|nr:wolframin [Schistocerca nitens]